MRTILVIASQASFAHAIEAALNAERYRLISKEDVSAAGALLTRAAVDVVVLDLETTDAAAMRMISTIREMAPGCPLFVYADAADRTWEEQAYLLGVSHFLSRPVRAKLLINLLDRMVTEVSEEAITLAPALFQPAVSQINSRALEPLRRFSSLLVHSLDAGKLMGDAIQQLREALGINRAAVFLRKASALATDGSPSSEEHWLRPAHTIGHEPGLIREFPLSMSAGIGKYLCKHARILRSDEPAARAGREITKEFKTLGGAVALPIHDREHLLGVLVIDERITGGGFVDEELTQLFHWLEELAIALRNCWRHEQLAARHGIVDDVLAGIGSGCVVIGANCGILHANETALDLLWPGRKSKRQIEFAEIPQAIGSLVFVVLQKGESIAPFKWKPPMLQETTCLVTIRPFSVGAASRPNAALLVLDDITEQEHAAMLELEAGKLRLVRAMSWHLAHEIGNAVTPIATMQQLLELDGDDPESRKEMAGVLESSVKRITRLTQQMNFLSRDWDGKSGETIRVYDLLESAYSEAKKYYTGSKKSGLVMDKSSMPWSVTGDSKALRHAFSELFLNAILANPENPVVTVRVARQADSDLPRINVEMTDTGPGFPQDIVESMGEPFKTTRSVGLGLGLTVSRKIIQNHRGELGIPIAERAPGVIVVNLPASDAAKN